MIRTSKNIVPVHNRSAVTMGETLDLLEKLYQGFFLIMREGCERTECSMNIGEVRAKKLKQMFLLTGNAEKVVFQQQEKNRKMFAEE